MTKYLDETGAEQLNQLLAAKFNTKANKTEIPTKTSELTNDSGFGTYTKPSGGIPSSDLTSSVQTSLGKADTALQSSAIANMEVNTNKVTSVNSSSTNTEYPSAKCVYDVIQTKQNTLTAGTNISISNDTISATDTTYESKVAEEDGTDVSLVTTGEKFEWNNKFTLPDKGIPKAYLAIGVKTSLEKADTALQSEQYTGTITEITMNGTSKGTSGVVDLGTVVTDVSGKENTSNKVTSVSSSSTDTQYPTAKCLYTMCGDIESVLQSLNSGNGV